MSANTSTVKVLRLARALIEHPEKWGKGYPSRRPGTYCVQEAIETAAAGISLLEKRPALRVLEGVVGRHLAAWNDSHNRTHTDVLAAFDKAIATAEGGAA